jgi:hypothetical protein
MKKTSLIILTLVLTIKIFAQNIQTLDEKRGFKDFTIGDTYLKWEKQLSFNFYDEKDSTTNYSYIGTCCQEVFNYNVDGINLKFKNNKIVKIYIILKPFRTKYLSLPTDDYLSINNSLSNIFGTLTSIEKNQDEVIYKWTGKKIVLFSSYNYLFNYQRITITDYSYFLKNLKNNSGF